MPKYDWDSTRGVSHIAYKCGYCDLDVAPSEGYYAPKKTGASEVAHIYICPNCQQPTFMGKNNNQVPKPLLGRPITRIQNKEINSLYWEARACTSVGAYTASVMICRKILMNLAVSEKAKEDASFGFYVDYLFDNGYVPPKGKSWVDAIRKRGNEATHEIKLMEEKDAKLILDFTEGLLRFNYELPDMLEDDSKPKGTNKRLSPIHLRSI